MKTLLSLILVLTGILSFGQVFAQDFLAVAEKSSNKSVKNIEASEPAPETRSFTWEFFSAVKDEFTQKDYQKVGNHELGKDVACLMTILNERCIRKEQAMAGDPATRTMILKPVVYNAVRNIEKYCKRELKQGVAVTDDVMTYVLKVAIASLDTDDTASFEKALQEYRKDPKGQIKVFQNVRLSSVY